MEVSSYASLFSLILGVLLAVPQIACAGVQPSSTGGVSVQLEDEGGRRLNTYHHGGTTYVLGHMGRRYNVRVFNRTAKRIETVVTVDGRDVISGQIGNYADQRGIRHQSLRLRPRRGISRIHALTWPPSDSPIQETVMPVGRGLRTMLVSSVSRCLKKRRGDTHRFHFAAQLGINTAVGHCQPMNLMPL